MGYYAIVLGLGAIIIPVLLYFHKATGDKQIYKQGKYEERIKRVVDEYININFPIKKIGHYALVLAGVLSLKSDEEIREACKRIQLRCQHCPLPGVEKELKQVDLFKIFQTVDKYKLSASHPDFIKNAKKKLLEESSK